jgi:hypothetical protein
LLFAPVDSEHPTHYEWFAPTGDGLPAGIFKTAREGALTGACETGITAEAMTGTKEFYTSFAQKMGFEDITVNVSKADCPKTPPPTQ